MRALSTYGTHALGSIGKAITPASPAAAGEGLVTLVHSRCTLGELVLRAIEAASIGT